MDKILHLEQAIEYNDWGELGFQPRAKLKLKLFFRFVYSHDFQVFCRVALALFVKMTLIT